MEGLTQIFKALAEETRLQILALLIRHGELCVCDVEGTLEITHSKSSRHLRYLLNAGLVKNKRAGVWVHYRITENPSQEINLILQMVQNLITEDMQADLSHRLQQWLEKKALHGPGCIDAKASLNKNP